ncbi:hypothetical protein GBA52_016996 [Prunus armeniaca]|nr:hypothetical protein GBA52_016996 [Prunus armeniaca]
MEGIKWRHYRSRRCCCFRNRVSSTGWNAKNQKLTVVGQLDPVLIVTKLRKMASKTELISVGPAKEEI